MTLFAKLAAESMVADDLEDPSDAPPKKRNWAAILATAGLAGLAGYGGYKAWQHRGDIAKSVNDTLGTTPKTDYGTEGAAVGAGAGLASPWLTNRHLSTTEHGNAGTQAELAQVAKLTDKESPRFKSIDDLTSANKAVTDTTKKIDPKLHAQLLDEHARANLADVQQPVRADYEKMVQAEKERLSGEWSKDPNRMPEQLRPTEAPTRGTVAKYLTQSSAGDTTELGRAFSNAPKPTLPQRLFNNRVIQIPGVASHADRTADYLSRQPERPLDPAHGMHLSTSEMADHLRRIGTRARPMTVSGHAVRAGLGALAGGLTGSVYDAATGNP